MKIIALECWKQEFLLKESYRIAYEHVSRCTNVFLKLTTDTGITGWGCAAPDFQVTGESAEAVAEVFGNTLEPVLKGENPFRYAFIMDVIKKQIPLHPSAMAMADIALYDIMSQQAKVPLFQLLGGYRDKIATSITIGILPVKEAIAKAKKYISQGFQNLKLKGGKNVEDDIEKVIRIREVAGSAINIRFDANQGYSVEDAIHFINQTKMAGVEIFEQPTDKKNDDLIKEVTGRVSVPVMADEALVTLKDAFRLTSSGSMDMINIKLMKVGGITEAMHVNSVAKAAGIEAMVGCMDESALGIAAGMHFALSRPNILYADLDGHLDFIDDPFAGMLRIKEGVMYPSELPGLGVI